MLCRNHGFEGTCCVSCEGNLVSVGERTRLLLLNSAPIPDVDIKYVGGADPEMVFLDAEYAEVEVGLRTLLVHY